MNFKKVISACTASMLGLTYFCSAFSVSAAEKEENLLVLGDASSKGFETLTTVVDVIENKLNVNYKNLSQDESTTKDLIASVKANTEEIKKADTIVISAGMGDYMKEIAQVLKDYAEPNDSAEDIRAKMVADTANIGGKISTAFEKVDDTKANIEEAVQGIKDVNPNAEIYVLSMFNPFEYDYKTKDALIDAVKDIVSDEIDNFNAGIGDIIGVKIADTNKTYEYLLEKYNKVSGNDASLSVKNQFNLAAQIMADMTGKTKTESVNDLLSMIPVYMIPFLPTDIAVANALEFSLGSDEIDLSIPAAAYSASLKLNIAENSFGISSFQANVVVTDADGNVVDKIVPADAYKDSLGGSWAISKNNKAIQFVSENGRNITDLQGVLGTIEFSIDPSTPAGTYNVELTDIEISVLTLGGQKSYKADSEYFTAAAGSIVVKDKAVVTTTTKPVVSEVTTTVNPVVTGVTTTIEPVVTGVTTTIEPVVTGVTTTIEPVVTGVTTTIEPVVTGVTTTIEPVVTGVTTTPAPVVTGVTTTIEPVVTGVTTTIEPVVTGVTTTIEPVVTGVTTTPAPVVTGVTTTPAPVVTGVTTTPAPVVTSVTTTNPDTPPVTTIKKLQVPTGEDPSKLIKEVPLTQFYYSYDNSAFSLDGLKVEAVFYGEDSEEATPVDITSFIKLQDETATPLTTFIEKKTFVYDIKLELNAESDNTITIDGEKYDVAELKAAFDGTAFNAYIGRRGDFNLDFEVDTRDDSYIITEFLLSRTNDPSIVPDLVSFAQTQGYLPTINANMETLTDFALFLGDASIDEPGRVIDTRDSSAVIEFYLRSRAALLDNPEFNIDKEGKDLWDQILIIK